MPSLIIKTHQPKTSYKGNQIFILNKGMNSGKPQKHPFTNSFVINFTNPGEAETIYWLAYSLWKSHFWHQSLCGSVIPFLKIKEFKKGIYFKSYRNAPGPRSAQKPNPSAEVAGTTRNPIPKKHPTHQRNAKSNFTQILQKIINLKQRV